MTKKQIHEYLVSSTVDQMTSFLIEDYGLSVDKALDRIYNSKIYSHLGDESNGLYTQSPLYIYEHLKRELNLN